MLLSTIFLTPAAKSISLDNPYLFKDTTKTSGPEALLDPLQWFREDSVSCVIPFTKVGNLILVKAKVDTTEGNFILDTGAPYLILNLIYFRDRPSTLIQDESQTSVNGSSEMISRTEVNSFFLGSINHHRISADLVDLGHIENSKGVKILGLIGLSLLRQCEMIIDYEKKLIYLHRMHRKEASKYKSEWLKDESAYLTLPFDIKNDKLVAETEMAGKKLNFVLDSGAEINLLDSRLSEKIFESVDITGRVNIRGSDNSTVEALRGNLRNMTIAKESLGILPVLVTNLERTCFDLHSCVNGVLGFDFMPLKKIGFNFSTRKMYLWR